MLRIVFISCLFITHIHLYAFELQPVNLNTKDLVPGVIFRLYDLNGAALNAIPEIPPKQIPNHFKVQSKMVMADYLADFRSINHFEYFLLYGKSFIEAKEEKKVSFRFRTNNISTLVIDGVKLITNTKKGNMEEVDVEVTLPKGWHQLETFYLGAIEGYREISLWWYNEKSKSYEYVPEKEFFYDKNESVQTAPKSYLEIKGAGRILNKPGDRSKLTSVHPSFTLLTLNRPSFTPRVGGMDFLPDGRLVISTWDSLGQVYIVSGVQGGDTGKITYKRIAWGLAEPLGLKVVDGRIFVLQKQELTELVDLNGDEVIDEYRTICNSWGATGNFHEFAFGLIFKEGYFYAALAIAIQPGGRSTIPQNKDRGRIVKIGMDGSLEFYASGLRTPNGIGLGPEGEIFVADNQGDWLPSCKMVHIKKGGFYNNYAVELNEIGRKEVTPPVVWFPQNEMGNSNSQPLTCKDGPYKGHVLLGDVHYGGLQRVFMEKVNGEWQGCAFKFSQGFEGGTNRLIYGPDGSMYIGEIGSSGNWGQYGKAWYGLEKLTFNGKSTFEVLAVRAKANGFEIEFTQPLDIKTGNKPKDYKIEHWKYVPTMQYGGPKVDLDSISVQSVNVSKDRKTVFVELENLQEGTVVYIHLDNSIRSIGQEELWTNDAFYTLNAIPESKGIVLNPKPKPVSSGTGAVKPKPKAVAAKFVYIPPTSATLDQGRALIATSGCLGCHNLTQKILGPSYKMIAERYKEGEPDVKKLTDKVYFGGGGVWGEQAMSTHTHLKKEDITKMVQYILSLK